MHKENLNVSYTHYDIGKLNAKEQKLLKKLSFFTEKEDAGSIRKLLEDESPKGGSSIYYLIVFDVEAFFDLSQTMLTSRELSEKFKNLDRSEVKDLLLDRINCIHDNTIKLPEKLFVHKVNRLKIDERTIDVMEVSRRNWDYILYKSSNYADEYFANINFPNGIADYNLILPLDKEEIEVAKNGTKEQIINMIDRKRIKNRKRK